MMFTKHLQFKFYLDLKASLKTPPPKPVYVMSTGISKIPALKGHLPKFLAPILLHKALVVRALLYTLTQLDFRAQHLSLEKKLLF